MARTRQPAASAAIDAAQTQAETVISSIVDETDDLSDVDKLRIALGDYAGAGMVKVYRVDTRTNKMTYLQTIDPAEYLNAGEEMLRDQYGTGTYEIRVYEDGRVVTRGRTSVEAPRWQSAASHDPHRAAQTTINVPPAPSGADGMAAIVAAMNEGFRAMIAAMPKPADPMQQLGQLRALADIVRPPSQSNSIQEMATMFTLFKSMQGDSGGGSETSELGALVALGRPLIEKMVASAPGTAPAPAALPVPESPVTGFLGQLVEQAKLNADVGPLADLIVEQTPPALLDDLLSAPDWFERLAAQHPGVGAQQAWFSRLYAALTSDEKPEQNPPG